MKTLKENWHSEDEIIAEFAKKHGLFVSPNYADFTHDDSDFAVSLKVKDIPVVQFDDMFLELVIEDGPTWRIGVAYGIKQEDGPYNGVFFLNKLYSHDADLENLLNSPRTAGIVDWFVTRCKEYQTAQNILKNTKKFILKYK